MKFCANFFGDWCRRFTIKARGKALERWLSVASHIVSYFFNKLRLQIEWTGGSWFDLSKRELLNLNFPSKLFLSLVKLFCLRAHANNLRSLLFVAVNFSYYLSLSHSLHCFKLCCYTRFKRFQSFATLSIMNNQPCQSLVLMKYQRTFTRLSIQLPILIGCAVMISNIQS